MLYAVFDFADKEVSDVMVPRPEVVALVDRDATRGVPRGPRSSRRTRATRSTAARSTRSSGSSTCATSSAPRSRPAASSTSISRSCSVPPHIVPETRTWPRSFGLPAHEGAHGDRRRRVRGDGGHRDARGPARGDRRRDRGRVRPPGRVGRARRRQTDPNRRDVPDRRLQRGVPGRAPAGGLPHGRRLRLRPARPRAARRRRGEHDGLRFTVLEINGSRIERLEVEFQKVGHRGVHEDGAEQAATDEQPLSLDGESPDPS